MSYLELKWKHQKEFNEFPMFFAFNRKQFDEGMKTLGLKPNQTNKVYSFDGGGFYRKSGICIFRLNLHSKSLSFA